MCEVSKMKLEFSSQQECKLNMLEYQGLWHIYGSQIVESFEEVTGLNFLEETIKADVGRYSTNFAGNNLNEPMQFRFSVRHKLGTLFHELSHRLLLEHNLEYFGIVENDHEFIDLFLFDVVKLAFGEAAAYERMNYELTFPEEEIPNAWKKIMMYNYEERQKLMKQIIHSNNE